MGRKEFPCEIRAAYREEWQDAMLLTWKTFLKFEAVEYSQEGINSFNAFITDSTLYRMFLVGSYELFVALDGKKIIGVISIRNESHISLLFVDAMYHKRGVGKALMEYLRNYLLSEAGVSRITVNSSPYAVGFYHKMGFQDLGSEETKDGIRYTPMEFFL